MRFPPKMIGFMKPVIDKKKPIDNEMKSTFLCKGYINYEDETICKHASELIDS